MGDVHELMVDVGNPLHVVPDDQKINFPGVRKREIEISCVKTDPALGWTAGQELEFVLNTDVGILDLQHMILRAKFRQVMNEESVLLKSMNSYWGLAAAEEVMGTKSAAVTLSSKVGTTKRVFSPFDMEYGGLSLFSKVEVKVNDKTLDTINDLDKIQKFLFLKTGVRNMSDEFSKFHNWSMARDSTGNFDTTANASGTWFDIMIPVSSILDEFPLFPLYKITGQLSIIFTLNEVARAYAPAFRRNDIGRFCSGGSGAITAAVAASEVFKKDVAITWNSQPDISYYVKEPKISVQGLELLSDAGKDMENTTKQYLTTNLSYKTFTSGTQNHQVDFGLKIPSVRYVMHSVVNRYSDTMIVPTGIEFKLGEVNYTIRKPFLNSAEIQLNRFDISPVDSWQAGLMFYAQTSYFTLPLLECSASIGNLQFPSDIRYKKNLTMYLLHLQEFYGYNSRSFNSTEPMVRYKNLYGKPRLEYGTVKSYFNLIVNTSTGTAGFSINPQEGMEDFTTNSAALYEEEPFTNEITERFTTDDIETLGTTTLTAADMCSRALKSSYLWNFSKMLQKGKAIAGDLDSEFSNSFFNYTLSAGITNATKDTKFMDLQWQQIAFSDASISLVAKNGNFELFK